MRGNARLRERAQRDAPPAAPRPRFSAPQRAGDAGAWLSTRSGAPELWRQHAPSALSPLCLPRLFSSGGVSRNAPGALQMQRKISEGNCGYRPALHCKTRTLLPEPSLSRLRKARLSPWRKPIFPLSGSAPRETEEESPSCRKDRVSFPRAPSGMRAPARSLSPSLRLRAHSWDALGSASQVPTRLTAASQRSMEEKFPAVRGAPPLPRKNPVR